jgi:molybdenum cofactor cytidylyltransferase
MSRPVVLVLASGRGERFIASGGSGSKLDALLGGKSVLDCTVDVVRASGLPWHLEQAQHAGMGDCIAAAVRATQDATGWLVLPGDLPLVQPESLQMVAGLLATHAVVLPQFHGQRGHPVGFGAVCRDALMALRGPQGAASVVRAQEARGPALRLELDDAGIVTDIDTLQDLEKARLLLPARQGSPAPCQKGPG